MMTERTIPMHKKWYPVLWYDKEKDEYITKEVPGYVFSFIGVNFGCTQFYYTCEGELKKSKSWELTDLDTQQIVTTAVSRRAFSNILTPDFIDKWKSQKAEQVLAPQEV